MFRILLICWIVALIVFGVVVHCAKKSIENQIQENRINNRGSSLSSPIRKELGGTIIVVRGREGGLISLPAQRPNPYAAEY